jgi:hypothetical protein
MKQPFLLPLLAASSTGAFTSPSTNSQRPIGVKLDAVYRDEARETSRRDVLQIIGGSFAMAMGANVMSAQALVSRYRTLHLNSSLRPLGWILPNCSF